MCERPIWSATLGKIRISYVSSASSTWTGTSIFLRGTREIPRDQRKRASHLTTGVCGHPRASHVEGMEVWTAEAIKGYYRDPEIAWFEAGLTALGGPLPA